MESPYWFEPSINGHLTQPRTGIWPSLRPSEPCLKVVVWPLVFVKMRHLWVPRPPYGNGWLLKFHRRHVSIWELKSWALYIYISIYISECKAPWPDSYQNEGYRIHYSKLWLHLECDRACFFYTGYNNHILSYSYIYIYTIYIFACKVVFAIYTYLFMHLYTLDLYDV